MKGKIPIPVVVGAIVVVLFAACFLFWRSAGGGEPHETPAPAKDPATNPMFQQMRNSMRGAGNQTASQPGSR